VKVPLFCGKCSDEGKRVSAIADLCDDGTYDVQCRNGHRVLTVLQNQRFELLVDSGALALRDDYYREAVATFAAALEAFWGFYVRVVARHLNAPTDTIEQLRKDVRLSECRLGAMHLAHLLLVGRNYKGDDDKRRKFRNKVVHDGVFPSREKATDYARYVYDTILDGVAELRRLAPAASQREIGIEVGRGQMALREKVPDTRVFDRLGRDVGGLRQRGNETIVR
jgi:hypothetical protein